MEEFINLIDKVGMSATHIGGESDEREGWVVINSPGHFAFAEIVVRMLGDERDSPECVERVEALRQVLANIDQLCASYYRMKDLEKALANLVDNLPPNPLVEAQVAAALLLK